MQNAISSGKYDLIAGYNVEITFDVLKYFDKSISLFFK